MCVVYDRARTYMQRDKVVSNVEFKGSFDFDVIIGYRNIRPLLRSVEFSKGFCHLLILEDRLVETTLVMTYEKAYK